VPSCHRTATRRELVIGSVIFKPPASSGLDVLKSGDKIRPLLCFSPGRLADPMPCHVANVPFFEVVSCVQIHGQMRCLPCWCLLWLGGFVDSAGGSSSPRRIVGRALRSSFHFDAAAIRPVSLRFRRVSAGSVLRRTRNRFSARQEAPHALTARLEHIKLFAADLARAQGGETPANRALADRIKQILISCAAL
jgi:hypothetical protein